jgi:hypothetical protein
MKQNLHILALLFTLRALLSDMDKLSSGTNFNLDPLRRKGDLLR